MDHPSLRAKMDMKTYMLDPCGASSLPFWKTNAIAIPDDLLILRADDPRLLAARRRYTDTLYFKLIHPMTHIVRPSVPKGFRFICPDEKAISEHIASCYDDVGVTSDALSAYRHHPTFAPDLWLAVVSERTGKIVASGIAELDTDIREGILEWIQVSPEHRGRGWGSIIVRELLFRMIGRADFVTFSGKEDDPLAPRALYEHCGFGGNVIWHFFSTGVTGK